eukprot:CAMPEP_0184738234 /NCGR_PEP_ID=MMETSP0315-20130426/946_1 /TAXON_ID=101924 /ORGANISM="Rhodosorus marinus, Strain UTEX LB 2760" /LENGTH=312 /DNA_ID=CAMNT_0027205875 /DNA_START=73 /DNA_END=1011 /DNA_ORIENTATION=-
MTFQMSLGFVQSGFGQRVRSTNTASETGRRVRFVTRAVVAPAAPSAPAPTIAPAPELYKIASDLGEKNSKKPIWKIFISSILGGAYIGYGSLLALTVGGACPGLLATNPGLQQMVFGAFGLPFGLMMVLVTGAELFTGNTMTVSAAFHEKKVSVSDIAKSWIVSFGGNLVGSVLLAYLAAASGVLATAAGPLAVAKAKTSLPFIQLLVRGILCNWLVTAAVYMASGARDLGGKMIAIWFPISAFVAMKFEHSVANMFMIPFGIMLGAGVSWQSFFLGNLLPVTLGNIVGGALIMATMNAVIFGSALKKKIVS